MAEEKKRCGVQMVGYSKDDGYGSVGGRTCSLHV